MHFHQRVSVWLGYFSIIWRTATCVPTQRAASNLLNIDNDIYLPLNLSLPFSNSLFDGLSSSSTNPLRDVGIDHMTWIISDTISLAITICNWQPDPKTILAVLAAADTIVGKKAAKDVLTQKFTQRSDNKFNKLLLEIKPDSFDKVLTWGHVAEVLGPKGLPKFYEETRLWNTVYFDIMHKDGVSLGSGAVRRWWQLAPPTVGVQ